MTQVILSTSSPITSWLYSRGRPLIALLWSCCPSIAAPLSYDLTVVARTGDVISGKTLTAFKLASLGANSPAINNTGRVAFYATYSDGFFDGEGIFTPSSVIVKTGDVIDGRTVNGISFIPALNDSGMVVVRGLLDSQGSAILTPKTLLTADGSTIGGQRVTDFGPPAINNHGTVAFAGSLASGAAIFTQTALLAKSNEPIHGQRFASFGSPAINDRGTVAFQGWHPQSSTTAILTPTTVLVKTGETIDGKTLTDILFGSGLNSTDTIAFTGTFPGGMGVFTQKALLVQSGDTVGGQKLTSFGVPVIDDRGTVVYFGTYVDGVGIFTQSSLIAKTGDTIAGKTLTSVGQPAMNGGGGVVFAAQFSDGSSAIMLARPVILKSSRRYAPRERTIGR